MIKTLTRAMELLPHVLVEDILQRLPVKSLVRFKSVSRLWSSTIKSQYFVSKHLIRSQSGNPDILLLNAQFTDDVFHPNMYPSLSTLTLGSSDSEKVNMAPRPNRCYSTTGSCDGLVCAYTMTKYMYVINPATRWYRRLPRAKSQQINRVSRNLAHNNIVFNSLGFGKDISTGRYKMVWLYDSVNPDLRGPTTCEVFDFYTNTWRYVVSAKHVIRSHGHTIYVDGSLYWITVDWFEEETKILSFNLGTEVFQVMSETPIIYAYPHRTIMYSLNNRLCVSVMKDNSQEIWTMNPHKTWEKIFCLNLGIASCWFGKRIFPVSPVALFEDKKLILHADDSAIHPGFVVYDARLDSFSLFFRVYHMDEALSYFPSLLSI